MVWRWYRLARCALLLHARGFHAPPMQLAMRPAECATFSVDLSVPDLSPMFAEKCLRASIVGRSSQAIYHQRNSAMDDSIGGS